MVIRWLLFPDVCVPVSIQANFTFPGFVLRLYDPVTQNLVGSFDPPYPDFVTNPNACIDNRSVPPRAEIDSVLKRNPRNNPLLNASLQKTLQETELFRTRNII